MRIALVLRSVAATWVAVLVAAVVGFLLTPYILHRLGPEAYGLWVLVVALADYSIFLGLGVRSAVVRFVSRNLALGDKAAVNRVVATSLYFYCLIGTLVIAISLLLAPYLPDFFSIGSEYRHAVIALFLLAGVVHGLDFPLNVFEGMLEAMGRFDLIYGFRVAGLAARIPLVILVLQVGGGLLAVGAVTVLTTFVARCFEVPIALRRIGKQSLAPRWLSKDVFKEMLQYGLISISVGWAQRLRNLLYPVVIAKFLSATAVTFFALPMKLLATPMEGVGSMTEFVNPASSQLEAREGPSRLGQLLLLSVQGAFLLLAPLAVTLFVFGRELLTLWVGGTYAASYPILVLLTVGLGVNATQCCAQSMLFGIGRHKGLVWLRSGEAVALLVLGIVLLKFWGLVGFAAAIAVSLVVVNLILIPRHLCRIVGMSLRAYLTEACLKPCILSLPLAAVLLGFRSLLLIHSWLALIFTLLIGGLVYALTLSAVTFWRRHPACGWLSLSVLEFLDQKFLRRRHGLGVPSLAGPMQRGEPEIGA